MKVCSDVLQIPILVITSMPRCSYVLFIPDEVVVTSTLYVAYNAFGPGHYHGTRKKTRVQGKVYYGLNFEYSGRSIRGHPRKRAKFPFNVGPLKTTRF